MCQSWAHQPRERREVAVERGRASAARCVRRATHKQLGTAPARGDDRDERAQRVETRARVDVSSSRARRRRRRRRLIVLFVFFRLFCFVGRRLGVADGDAAASRGASPAPSGGSATASGEATPEARAPPRAPRAPPRTRARRSSASPGGLGGTRARVSLGATRLSSPLVPSATWRREARRYPNPEAPLRSCARERVKGSGSREVEATVAFQFRVAMCRKKPRAPRIGRELLHARRALFALGVLIRHEELLGGRHRREGVFLLGGRLLAHRALPTPSRVPTPNPTTAGRRRDDFRLFQHRRDVVACQSTSRAAGTRLRAPSDRHGPRRPLRR